MGRRFNRQKPIEAIEPRVLLSTLYVDANATGTVHDGTSWNSAYLDLQLALATSVSGDEIRVADGTYKPTSGTDQNASFRLKSGVKLFGGYGGESAPNPDLRAASYESILSGDIGVQGDKTDNSYNVLVAYQVNATGVLDRFTITAGNMTSSRGGGGIFNTYSSVIISNCIFVNNTAQAGGAMYNQGGSPSILNCRFLNNYAIWGGGIYNDSATVMIRSSTFLSNSASSGGGIFHQGGASSEISECTFEENFITGTFTDGGAALVNNGGDLSVVDSTFSRNVGGAFFSRAFGSSSISRCTFIGNLITAATRGFGPAIQNGASALSISDCIFTQNSDLGSGNGGAIYNRSDSHVVIARCSFNANRVRSGGCGGAIYIAAHSTASIVGSSFVGNRAGSGTNSLGSGGALYAAYHSSSVVDTSTFVRNVAGSAGGFYAGAATVEVSNCIFWANVDASGYQLFSFAPVGAITYNDIQGGYDGVGNIAVDPQFARDPHPGADAAWGTTDDDYGNLSLRSTSQCLDAGNNAAVPPGVTMDLAGAPRLVDIAGINDFGAVVDMGAYERVSQVQYLIDALKPSIKVAFETGISCESVQANDLQLTFAGTNTPGNISAASVAYDALTRTATWHFASPLPDGDFRATIPAGSVSDSNGIPLAADVIGNFWVLSGDANRDRKVDIADLAILATNWHGSGKLFSQGDFNYDGVVDSVDLAILAARWQQNLAPPVAPAPVSIGIKAAVRKPVRMVSVVG